MANRRWIAGMMAILTGCGDSGTDSVSGSETGSSTTSGPAPTSTTGEPPTTSASESATGSTSGVSDSMTQATTSPETGATDTSSTSPGTSSSESGGTTDGAVCEVPDLSPGMVGIDAACTIEEMVGSWQPVVEWQDATLGDSYTTPAIANCTDDNGDGVIDGDDVPDIAVATSGGTVHLLSGDGAGKHWTAPQNLGSEPSSATIADLDGDGKPEVVVSGPNGFFAWHGDTGALMWQNAMGGSPTVCGGTSVYDVDGFG